MGVFDITQFMSDESKKGIKDNFKIEKISVRKMKPSKENFYSIDEEEITRLARTIELVGLQQNFVVKKIPNTDEYEVIAGHKRRLAILKLLEEGKEEFEMQPCKVIYTDDDIKNELTLIFTNSTQRVRTDAEMMKEVEETEMLLKQLRETQKIEGRTDEIIAQLIGSSKSQVARLKKINNKLIEPLKSEYEAGNISTAAADKAASLPAQRQKEVLKKYEDTGELKADDVLSGQMDVNDFPEMVPEGLKEEIQKDTTSLVINGAINPNKEYGGVNINIIVATLKEDDGFFDNFFFKKIYKVYREAVKQMEMKKSSEDLYASFYKIYDCFEDINGCLEEFEYKGEHIEVLYAGQSARFMYGDIDEQISYKDIAEVAYAMICTRMIDIDNVAQEDNVSNQDESRDELNKEISSLKQDLDKYYEYLTDIEKRTIQDILTVAAERGGGRL